MLIRSTWTLKPVREAVLPPTYTVELIKQLHVQMGLPFEHEIVPAITYSGLLGQVSTARDYVTFNSEQVYQLTIGGLQADTSSAIAALELGEQLEILGTQFQVCDRRDVKTSYESLYHDYLASEPVPQYRFLMQFLTPTAFSQGRLNLPLPMPALMFRSWLERWNHFASIYLGSQDLIQYLSEAVALTQHRLQTRTFSMSRNRVTGFTGQVTLQILSRTDPLLCNVANLLMHYAPFVGTGVKTRLGMGVTMLEIQDYKK